MNERLYPRLGALLGLALAAAVATWWLAATRLALAQSLGTVTISGSALAALWLARAVVLPALTLRASAWSGGRRGTAAALLLVITPWPVVVAAGAASRVPTASLLAGEGALVAVGLLLAAVGHGLGRRLRRRETAALAGTVLGIAVAAVAWTWGPGWSGVTP